MRLVIVSSLAALVLAPIVAEAAQAPVSWSASLSGRVVETYSYTKTTASSSARSSAWGRLAGARAEVPVRLSSLFPGPVHGRLTARPVSRAFGLRPAREAGVGSSGGCAERARSKPLPAPARRSASPRAWFGLSSAGPARIGFPSGRSPEPRSVCGIEDRVSTDGWLHLRSAGRRGGADRRAEDPGWSRAAR